MRLLRKLHAIVPVAIVVAYWLWNIVFTTVVNPASDACEAEAVARVPGFAVFSVVAFAACAYMLASSWLSPCKLRRK